MHERVSDDGLYELAATLLCASKDLNSFLARRKAPALSFASSAPNVPLSSENAAFFDAKGTIVEAAEQIIRLVRGPRDVLLDLSFQHCASASLQIILTHKIHHVIPLTGATTFAKITEAVGHGLSQALVERVLQHAMSFGLFEQAHCGHVAHNAVSALLVSDPDLEAWLALCANIAYPAGAQLPKALEMYGASSEANEAAYGVSIGRKISQFQRFREPDGHELHELFAKAMRGISAGGAYDMIHAVTGYPWESLEEQEALIVDVGGGPGHVSMALAQKHPGLHFEVQDLPETVEVGARDCPGDLKKRIAFKPHDFFEPQPEHSIDAKQGIAYFARFILHDWSDKYAQRILQALATNLRTQDRIILNEVVVPEPGQSPREIERRLHDRNMLMLMNLNGRERTESAFTALFQAVTPRLRLSKVYHPPQGELSLIEVVLDEQPVVNGHGH